MTQNNQQANDDTSPSVGEYEQQIRQKSIGYFPLPSLIAALGAIGFLILLSDARLTEFYGLHELAFSHETKLSAFALVAILVLWDTHRYIKKRRQAVQQFDALKNYLKIVWQSKKKQQQKANIYSDHAEKLKLFISDKLLEYIEYDEKFLHFKGIAAEVRHNGVISYDKIITALQKAIEQQRFLAIYEQSESNGEELSTHSLDSLSQYQNAIDALRYLWDLLDLSTADNMALHIGNQLIECEEHYYQLHLDVDKKLDITQTIPVSPTFPPQLAVLKTVSLLADEVEIRNLIALANINTNVLSETILFENSQFRIQLQPVPELLGNPNHIILLLENLIKNAQFFSQKTQTKQKSDRIAVHLQPGIGFARFTIYNRGPLIKQENLEKLFQLGFSTRRSKQYHGKGLGLFFANEIVKGYQGKICVTNVETAENLYLLTLTLASGEKIERTLSVSKHEKQLLILDREANEFVAEFIFESDIPIVEIQVNPIPNESAQGAIEVNKIEANKIEVNKEAPLDWLDPSNDISPCWNIQLNGFRKHHKLNFKPLDIQGVRFDILLPTADSRLNEQELDFSLF